MTFEGFAYLFIWERYLKQFRKPHGGYITSLISSSFRAHYYELLKEGIGSLARILNRTFGMTIDWG